MNLSPNLLIYAALAAAAVEAIWPGTIKNRLGLSGGLPDLLKLIAGKVNAGADLTAREKVVAGLYRGTLEPKCPDLAAALAETPAPDPSVYAATLKKK